MGVIVNGFMYSDSCCISASKGVDESGIEQFDTRYTGFGNLQFGSGGDTSLKGDNFQASPKLFLPIADVLFSINDSVEVTTHNSRVMKFTIRQWKATFDPDFPEINGTCIWLKGGVDEQ